MKRSLFLTIILALIFTCTNVYAGSYSMTLTTNSRQIERNSTVDIYINLNNISGIADGLNACELNLDYDSSKITINSITGENGWNITQGEALVLDSSNSVTTVSNIAKINAKVLGDNTITINNIKCTDSINEYTTNANTLTFNTNVSQDGNNNGDYNSSDTVDSSQTGVKEWAITFLLIATLSLVFKKLISKKDLFKKI